MKIALRSNKQPTQTEMSETERIAIAKAATEKNINSSRTIKTVKNFYDIMCAGKEPERRSDESFFLKYWEIDFAKAVLCEFGEYSAKTIANAILAVIETQSRK